MKEQRFWTCSGLWAVLLLPTSIWLVSCRPSSAGEAQQAAAERQETAAQAEERTAEAQGTAAEPLAMAASSTAPNSREATQTSLDPPQEIAITVHKRTGCGCCTKWVEHLRENGFDVAAAEVPEPELQALKQQLGVPTALQSCHTATVNGYVFEGHVPADLIRRFLAEAPQMVGLAVPGMPIGSPGMEMPGREGAPYDVIAFDRDGNTAVYESR